VWEMVIDWVGRWGAGVQRRYRHPDSVAAHKRPVNIQYQYSRGNSNIVSRFVGMAGLPNPAVDLLEKVSKGYHVVCSKLQECCA
jgi:hypothetical protein